MTDIPAGYKQTEIGIIPNDWNVSNITNSFSMKARIGWQGLRTDEYLNNGNYYLITGQDFDNGKIGWDNCYYVDKKRYDQDKHIQIKPLDVLVTKDGTIGKVAFIDSITKPATLNSGVFVLRTKNDSVYQKFFYYLLSSFYFDNFMSQITAGSTIVHLYQKDFIKFEHIVPSYKEQKEIANTLSDMDELISNLNELIEKKKNIKKGVMQKIFSNKIGQIETTLGKLCNISTGDCVTKAESNNGKYPIISGGVTPLGFINKYNCESNTVTIARAGTAGFVNYIKTKFWLNDKCFSIIPKKQFDSLFLYYYLKFYEDDVKSLQAVGTVPTVNIKNLSEFVVIHPEKIEEQKEIATILSDMDKEIEALEQKKIKYENIKIGAMQKLLTGKIRLV